MKTTDELDVIDAKKIARRVLEGSDPQMGWRSAGYRSARACARVLVGDGYSLAVERLATELVATELDE